MREHDENPLEDGVLDPDYRALETLPRIAFRMQEMDIAFRRCKDGDDCANDLFPCKDDLLLFLESLDWK